MRKYIFLVHWSEYSRFLEDLRRLGVVHVQERPRAEPSEKNGEISRQLEEVTAVRRLLEQRESVPPTGVGGTEPSPQGDAAETARAVRALEAERERGRQELAALDKELKTVAPWGDFSSATLERLREHNLEVRFFTTPAKTFDPAWKERYFLEVISRVPPDLYFVVVAPPGETIGLAAEEVHPPGRPAAEVRQARETQSARLEQIERELDEQAARGLPALRRRQAQLEEEADLEAVLAGTRREAGEAVMVLEGFVPRPREERLAQYCEDRGILYLAGKPTPEDAPPVLLENNRFSRLFEPIGSLFSLPNYGELDLTPFFAPFFMLFFGFCLGDAGYGLVVLLGATLYKPRAREGLKPVLTLAQFLGLATILFGALTGTFFGINLIEADIPWLESVRRFMLDSDQAFRLALVLGLVQILFGLFLQAANRIRQYGFVYGLPVFGWVILLLSLLDIGYLNQAAPLSTYTAWTGVGLILLFSDPRAGIFGRLGKGVWELYGITGFFGDLLSYIRLFALGISSAILGFVVNDIALQIKGGVPLLGPVLFVLFLLVGHTANLLISALGSFVHPMRLTFVEFYKNAGFRGGGKAYKPFAKRAQEERVEREPQKVKEKEEVLSY